MSQKTTIFAWLEERGDRGVHSHEFYERFMPRGAAVIHALKKEGHAIESRHESYKGESEGVRYFLRSEELVPGVESSPAPRPLVGAATASQYDPYSDFS